MAKQSGGANRTASQGGFADLMQDVMAGFAAAQSIKSGGARTPPRPARKGSGKPSKRNLAIALVADSFGGKLEAVGWLLAAGAILAWPRERALFDWSFLSRRQPVRSPESEIAEAEALEPGRGRSARHPGEIPWRGWRDILWRAWTEFQRDNIPQVAGGVAFFGVLAIFPAMAAFVSLYGLFFDLGDVESHLHLLAGVLPAEALDLVSQQLLRLAQARATGGLSLAFVVSILFSIWSTNAGIKALLVGLNVAFEEREKRNLLALNATSLAFTLGALVFMILAMAAMVAAPIVLAFVGYKGSALAILRWPFMFLVAVGAIAVLYRYGPSRQRERWRWVSWGSVIAGLLWLLVSVAFSIYVGQFGHYDKTYGSLGAAIGFMSWMWLSSIAVLFGAEVNSEIEHQTAVDTTTGEPAPMGARGAFMADTLGRARHHRSQKAPSEPPVPGRSPTDERARDHIRKGGLHAATRGRARDMA